MCVYIDAYTHTCVLTEIHMYGFIECIYIYIYKMGVENRTNLPFCQKYFNFNGTIKHCKHFVLFIFVGVISSCLFS